MATNYFMATTANATTQFADQTAIWTNWVSVTNSASTTADTLWQVWNQGTASSATTIAYQPPRRSAAEIEAEKQRWAEQRRKTEEAAQRAEALLREHLTDEQERTLDRNGRFRVRGSKGGVFDICRGNVIEYDDQDRRKASVCIHARGLVPEPDNMLAKKFLLETDEEAFRRIGNFSP